MNKKDDNDYDHLFKILLIGNSGVGKSCLLMRFSDNKFSNNFYNTIGVDFKLKNMMLEGKKIKLQIWDTAGQDRFRTITNSYYRNANGIMIVYDITDRESFENVQSWYAEIDKNADPNVARILVGNKNDMDDKRRVQYSEGQQMAKRYGIPFIETSAKNAVNVETVFHQLGQLIMDKVKSDPGKMKSTQNRIRPPVPPGTKPIENNTCCC